MILSTPGELDLRATPLTLRLNLTPNSDFVRTIEGATAADVFPAGCQIILRFGDGTTWAATISLDAPSQIYSATWDVDKAAVNTLIDTIGNNEMACELRYIDGTTDLTWAVTSRVAIG